MVTSNFPRGKGCELMSRDSWNKQKGKRKEEAKEEYVTALLKVSYYAI